jgi:hypothetical protein
MSYTSWIMGPRGSILRRNFQKILIAASGLGLLVGISQASTTITITNVPCNYLCFNVPNDAGVTLNYVDDAQQYGRVLVEMNGDIYDSGIWAIPRYAPVNDLALFEANGKVMYATLNFLKVSTGPCQRQGKVTVCPYKVTLQTGTLFLP